jgi:hypothetical protein
MTLEMRRSTLSAKRTSTRTAMASPPARWISLATVVMVDSDELGPGASSGRGALGSLMLLAATTTYFRENQLGEVFPACILAAVDSPA